VNDGYESVSKQRSADLFERTMAVGGQPFHNPVREGVPMVEASVHDAQAHPECNGNGRASYVRDLLAFHGGFHE
jgi:hypothetical protein